MLDPLSGVVAGVLMLTGYVLGRIRRRTQPSVEPICGCEHHLAKHDPETGHCHATEEITIYTTPSKWHTQTKRCDCRRYVGPEHILDVWAPPAPGLPPGSGRAKPKEVNGT